MIVVFLQFKKFWRDTVDEYHAGNKRWGVICGAAAALISSILFFANRPFQDYWWVLTVLPVVLFLLQGKLWFWWSKKKHLQTPPEKSPLTTSLLVAVLAALLNIANLIICRLIESPDYFTQWNQVQSGIFNDWHPVIHTYTLYLFARIWENPYFVASCFIVLNGILFGWLYYSMRRWGIRLIYCWGIIVFMLVSPVNLFAMRTLWKDNAFMLTLLALGIAMMNLYFSNGKWLEKLPTQCLLVFLLLYGSFVRHNGIIFTGTFILLLPLTTNNLQLRRKFIILSCITAVLCAGYIGGRSLLIQKDIIKPNKTPQAFHESVGIPMSMMTHAFVTAPEKLPPEVTDFMTQLIPWKKWKEYYTGDFNSVKFNAPGNLMGNIKKTEFFRLFIMTVRAAPQESFYGMKHVTSMAWDPMWNLFDIDLSPRFRVIKKYLGFLWTATGLYACLLMVLTLLLLPKKGIKILFMTLPFLIYNYGTALLLMGWDHRFFWGIIIGSLPVLATLLFSNGQEHNDTSAGK